MTGRPVRLGLLGNARITRNVILPALARSKRLVAVAIAARDGEAAARTAHLHGIARSFGDYDALLADDAVEAVYIALPNALHAEWTIRALAAGKHVLCEKPLAMNAAEVERIAAAAARAGRVALEAMMIRHHPRWAAMPELVASGELGDLLAIQGHFAFPLSSAGNIRASAALGGGVLGDLGIYLVTTALLLAGRAPVRVCAVVDRRREVAWAATMLLDFEGVSATGHCAFNGPRTQGIHAICAEGTVAMPQPFNPAPGSATELIVTRAGGDERTIAFPPADQFALQFDDFAAVIRGEKDPVHPLSRSLEAQRVLDAVRRSAEAGRWVNV